MTTMMVILTAVQSSPRHTEGWGWWFPFAFLFWIGLAALVVYLFTHVRGRPQPSGIDRARDIVAARFARGEISPDEYEERLSHLS